MNVISLLDNLLFYNIRNQRGNSRNGVQCEYHTRLCFPQWYGLGDVTFVSPWKTHSRFVALKMTTRRVAHSRAYRHTCTWYKRSGSLQTWQSVILFIKRLCVVATCPLVVVVHTLWVHAWLWHNAIGYGSRLLVHFISLQLWSFMQYAKCSAIPASVPYNRVLRTAYPSSAQYQRESVSPMSQLRLWRAYAGVTSHLVVNLTCVI